MEYRDYYKILGVPRTATQKEIQAAYRKLARKMHPDVNKAADAEAKFKAVNEAYEVLKDPKKRQQYDALGSNWRDGQSYAPSGGDNGGWQNVRFDFGDAGGGFDFFGADSQFSDFFQSLFGRGGPRGRGASGPGWAMKGQDQEYELELTLEEVYHHGTKTLRLQRISQDANGRPVNEDREINVKIPAGVLDGSRIRIAGQGSPGVGGGPAGDLYFKVRIAPNSRFSVDGYDLSAPLKVSPWEAALGARVEMPTLAETVRLTIPPGVQSGHKLRLRGKGLPGKDHTHGDLYAVIQIVVPRQLTDHERDLFEQLARVSAFQPRAVERGV